MRWQAERVTLSALNVLLVRKPSALRWAGMNDVVRRRGAGRPAFRPKMACSRDNHSPIIFLFLAGVLGKEV